MIAQLETRKEIIFEPGTGGGGSFWAGDNLLATLTVRGTVNRRGRLSICDDNRALDLMCLANESRYIYQMLEGRHLVGRAEWSGGDTPRAARLNYRGIVYTLDRKGLSAAGTQSQPVVAFDPLPVPQGALGTWNVRQLALCVTDRADLPLIGFYVFIAYDMICAVPLSFDSQELALIYHDRQTTVPSVVQRVADLLSRKGIQTR